MVCHATRVRIIQLCTAYACPLPRLPRKTAATMDSNVIKEEEAYLNAVLASNPPYQNNGKEEIACRLMIESLSEEEQEEAAQTSYAYFLASTSPAPQQLLLPEIRTKMAMRMAR